MRNAAGPTCACLALGKMVTLGSTSIFRAACFDASPTRRVDLAETTVDANETPHRHAVTLGFGAILSAKKIVLMAGKKQAKDHGAFVGRRASRSEHTGVAPQRNPPLGSL